MTLAGISYFSILRSDSHFSACHVRRPPLAYNHSLGAALLSLFVATGCGGGASPGAPAPERSRDEPTEAAPPRPARVRYRFSGSLNEGGINARVAGVLTITAGDDLVEVPGAECQRAPIGAEWIRYWCQPLRANPTTGARTYWTFLWSRAQPTSDARAAVGFSTASKRTCTERSLGCSESPALPPRRDPWPIRLKVVPMDESPDPAK